MNNINDTFFDGQYKEIWKSIIPDELTVKEVEFMVPYFKLEQGSRVLDLMCGYGRHAIALAKKGVAVTAVDNLDAYINEIKEAVAKEQLPVTAVKAEVIQYRIEGSYDLAICMGNSINFFNAGDLTKLFTNVATHLKPGGSFLISSWSIAEIAIKNFKDRSWSTIGDVKFLTDAKFLIQPLRIEVESTMIGPDGKSEIKTGVDYIYSINEIEAMLLQAGLLLKEVYSIPGRKKFTVGEPRAYLVAEKAG